eukprot:scaffold6843_cov66-Phaeocystis_antarctica.AAC.4
MQTLRQWGAPGRPNLLGDETLLVIVEGNERTERRLHARESGPPDAEQIHRANSRLRRLTALRHREHRAVALAQSVSTAIRYRTSTQREGGHQVPPYLTVHKGELGAAQPAAPYVPRERTIDAQRRRLLLATSSCACAAIAYRSRGRGTSPHATNDTEASGCSPGSARRT